MLRFAADENLNNDILRGLLRADSELEIVMIQDTECSGADDPTVLAWAENSGFCSRTDVAGNNHPGMPMTGSGGHHARCV